MFQGGGPNHREGAMGALAVLANEGPEGRKRMMEGNGFPLLVENLASGNEEVQVQAAAAIGSLASDALAMRYGPADLVSCISPLRELARTGSTPDAREKASGALLNVARSGGPEVQKAIYSEDKLSNQKGLDLLLDLAQNGPTAACKVGEFVLERGNVVCFYLVCTWGNASFLQQLHLACQWDSSCILFQLGSERCHLGAETFTLAHLCEYMASSLA